MNANSTASILASTLQTHVIRRNTNIYKTLTSLRSCKKLALNRGQVKPTKTAHAKAQPLSLTRSRRVAAPAGQSHASHDEYVPSVGVLQRWNALSSLPVCVTEVPGKGLGVIARRTLPAGMLVADYSFRLVSRARCRSGDYRIVVAGARGSVGKIDSRTFGPPIEGVAQVGALLNEPSVGMKANCEPKAGQMDPIGSANRRGSIALVTKQKVQVGEELTWFYGRSYGRRSYLYGQ